jgi:hypothetical protein
MVFEVVETILNKIILYAGEQNSPPQAQESLVATLSLQTLYPYLLESLYLLQP